MPSRFGVRQHIRQLFQSKKNTKHNPSHSQLPTSLAQTTPRRGYVHHNHNAQTPPTADVPFELDHSFQPPQGLDIYHISNHPTEIAGEPLGAGLEDVLYPSAVESTIQSGAQSLAASEFEIESHGDLGPRPKATPEELEGGLIHPGSEVPGTPIGAPEEYFTKDIRETKQDIETHPAEVPPEAINILPEPPSLHKVSSDRVPLALENTRLKMKNSSLSPSTATSQSQSVATSRPQSIRTGLGSRRNSSHDIHGHESSAFLASIPRESLRESPILGWSADRSTPIDPLLSTSSPEMSNTQKADVPRNADSGYWERRHVQDAAGGYSEPGDSATAHPYRGAHPATKITTQSTMKKPSRIFSMPGSYEHDAEIYHTHVPSVVTSIDRHVSYNPTIIHERTFPETHEIRTENVTRDFHTYEMISTVQPVVKPEYLPTKHIVQLENGKTREISEQEAETGNYRMLKEEHKVVDPALIMNTQEFAEKVRDLDRKGSYLSCTLTESPPAMDQEDWRSDDEVLGENQDEDYENRRRTFGRGGTFGRGTFGMQSKNLM